MARKRYTPSAKAPPSALPCGYLLPLLRSAMPCYYAIARCHSLADAIRAYAMLMDDGVDALHDATVVYFHRYYAPRCFTC